MSDSNPLFQKEGMPMFRRITAAHVEPAARDALSRAYALLEESEQLVEATWDRTIGALDRISDIIERVWTPVGHLMAVRNSPELRTAFETVEPEIIAFGLRVAQSEPFYRALLALKDTREFAAQPEVRRRIVDARLRDAKLGGIGLSGEARERFNTVVGELSTLQTRFSNHVLDATREFSLDLTTLDEAAGLPLSLRNITAQTYNAAHPGAETPATAEDGPWRITLDPPVVRPFLEYAERRDLRETVWRAFNRRASAEPYDNSPLIDRILSLRRDMAQMLGFSTYAELSLASKMADVAAVDRMHERLLAAAWTVGVAELDELRTYSERQGQSSELEHWDLPYYRRMLRDERFAFSYEDLKPYFPMPRVLEGLFELVGRIFDVKVVPADGEAQTWNDDVRFFSVLDSTGKRIAAFFLDAYSRPAEKRGGAWMSECQQRWFDEAGGMQRIPVAHLVCNGSPPVGGQPSLMGFEEVETLFHEFGHGLQHMLTTVDQPGAAGIANVEWDAVELPSQFMENWCYDYRTVMQMARHVETGEQLPDDLFEKLCASRTYAAATFLLRQLLLGMIDIELHHRYEPGGARTSSDVLRLIADRTSPLAPDPGDSTLCSFSHIFAGGYAAGYYSYKWAEVLSADAFEAFEEAGLDNLDAVAAVGRRFRDTVLALGGSRDPMRVFEDFRGRPPEPDALLRSYGLITSAA